MSRVRSIRQSLTGMENPDDLMMELMDALNDTVTPVPNVGQYYIFVYTPKTPNIRYDQNPLVGVTAIFEWGFRAINFHWNDHRQYTWNEVPGGLYEINDNELSDLDGIPFAKFRINS